MTIVDLVRNIGLTEENEPIKIVAGRVILYSCKYSKCNSREKVNEILSGLKEMFDITPMYNALHGDDKLPTNTIASITIDQISTAELLKTSTTTTTQIASSVFHRTSTSMSRSNALKTEQSTNIIAMVCAFAFASYNSGC